MKARNVNRMPPLPLLAAVVLAASTTAMDLQGAGYAWEEHDGYRRAPVTVGGPKQSGFTALSRTATGILFTNHLSYKSAVANQNLLNGAGLAAGDVDGDGLVDLYFCNLEGPNALYRNLGDWTFQEVPNAGGAACANMASRAAVFAHLNDDPHLDLLVSSIGGPNACLINDGNGQFKDITPQASMVLKAGGHSYAIADVDGDRDLDVYLANYGETSIMRSGGMISVRTVNGKPVVSGRHSARLKIIDGNLIELGEPDALYLNQGNGRFSPVNWLDGTFLDEEGKRLKALQWDMGLSVMFRDINRDTHPDIYICNDFQTPDRIWINNGKGKFRAIDALALRGTSQFSMGIDFADIDRDGNDDFFISDMLSRFQALRMTQTTASNPPPNQVDQAIERYQYRRNTLMLNRGDGSYEEIAAYAGVDASDWSWSVVFQDVDLDGYEDLLVANGHAYDTQDLDMIESAPTTAVRDLNRKRKELKDYPDLLTPNVLFRNNGNRTFTEVGKEWGFDATEVSHGISLVDLDNDGDQDVVVSVLWKPPLVYRNNSTAPRLAVRLKGLPPNHQGIGARIRVTGGPVVQEQEMICGGRYLAGDDPMRVFAAGATTNRLTIEVTWRSGARSVLSNALPNHVYELDEAAAQPAVATPPPPPDPPDLFTDVSSTIGHQHSDRAYNDFQHQPMLYKQLSRSGPGAGWFDLDGDGDEDLVIGSGRTDFLAVFRNDGMGGLKRWPAEAWRMFLPDDSAGIAGWIPAPGRRALVVARSNYESAPATPSELLVLDPTAAAPTAFPLPDNIGPVAIADSDGDGDLDVFVGGRAAQGKYPLPARSHLFRNNQGALQATTVPALQQPGIVNGAVWSDLNGDGWPDLVLACEWGPLRVLMNERGTLTDQTAALGLDAYRGWWQGVSTGDFDGDGRLDLIACNFGLNSHYGNPHGVQAQLYYGDLDQNTRVDLFEAYTDPVSGKEVPRRNLALLGGSVPLMRLWYPSHAAFKNVSMADIFAKANVRLQRTQASHLASAVFLNRGDRFEFRPLPESAQYSPAFNASVADVDGDGHEDLFLSQNFFAVHHENSRFDSGRGLWLRGDGSGGFAPIPAKESGVYVYGEQRGAALADFDQDGRIDLVVTQNNGPTKLYKNTGGQPGLRIRLKGPPGNPEAYGAQIRLVNESGQGPTREIHGGSGYWSQDGAVQIMHRDKATQVQVGWPGGKTVTQDIPPGTKELTVAF